MSVPDGHTGAGFTPREVCYRCDKPRSMCLCAQIHAVDNRTRVLVLQHPRERSHPVGTARLAALGLRNVRVEVAWKAGAHEPDPPAWLPADTALLYPTPQARELSALPVSERPRNLLVLDGTWHTAHSLYRDKVWLQRLPHVHFLPQQASRYRLRKQPAVQCVSTIEAIVEALRVLEPQTEGLSRLLAAFDAMIEAQLQHVQRRAGRPNVRKRRPPALRCLPEALVSGLSRMVIVYAESMREPHANLRSLVQLTACALGSGALLQHQLRPAAGLPGDALLGHMRLAASDFDAALTLPELRERWTQFLAAQAPSPIIAAWNESSLQLLRSAGLEVPAPFSLKGAYRGRNGRASATLDDALAAEGLLVEPNALVGRAASRIAAAAAVARHLHGLQHAAG